MIGTTLAHYDVTELLGKGGMGEVYRAVDRRLGRDVALKVLPPELSGDPERAARFEREARTLASLQHSNVAAIYGFEEVDGNRFLVMELVEGRDLRARLDEGRLGIDEVVDVARQIATGLEAAHESGIVHRDLKPENVMLTRTGEVKILDFGLARAWFGEATVEPAALSSPTITAAMTQAGTILGTAAYMSPEQARGRPVDRRADIWAFGAVLWEMVTGERLFDGETVSDTLAAVLRAEPDREKLPAREAPGLCRLIERCLVRDPQRRLRDVGEARIVLEDLQAGRDGAAALVGDAATPAAASFGRERGLWIALVAVLAIFAAAAALFREPAPERTVVRSTLLPPEDWDFAPASPFAISPDGRRIAFLAIARPENEENASGTNSVWVHDLGETEPRRVASTDRDAFPFWSPDGRWLGFFAEGKLNKVAVGGGPVVPVCDARDGRGGTWSPNGTIVFQREWNGPLMRVAARGGRAEPATVLDPERSDVAHRWPQFLPDGHRFLFYLVSTTNPVESEDSGLYVGDLETPPDEGTLLLKSESRGVAAGGHLLYRVGSNLMARPFDPESLALTGDPVPVATDVPGGTVSWGGAQFDASGGELLVHLRGALATNTVLQWRDREGEILDVVGEPGGFWEPALSHGGDRLALAIGQAAADIWVVDLERDTRTRFTFHSADDRSPQWSPDDRRIAFASSRNGEGEIFLRPASGQAEPVSVFAAGTQISLTDWSSDGRLIFFTRQDSGEDDNDVWAFDLETSEARPVAAGRFEQKGGVLSDDGKWLAFSSDESGRSEIYVQSFPEPTGRWMVSGEADTRPAAQPRWRRDGLELFYLRGGTLSAVSIADGDAFSFGSPVGLFNLSAATTVTAAYAVGPDGQRVLTNELPAGNRNAVVASLVQNWNAPLER